MLLRLPPAAAVASAVLCCATVAFAGAPEDIAQDVVEQADSIVQRIIHFFKEASYGRMIVLGVFVLGFVYLWRRKR